MIVYQILYSDVSDHLPEYATLKAMGYTDNYLLGVLLQEALFLAILGFLPGFILSFGLYQVTYAATMLPIFMNIDRAIRVWILTLIMCSFSGAIAMRKLRSADPADVGRSLCESCVLLTLLMSSKEKFGLFQLLSFKKFYVGQIFINNFRVNILYFRTSDFYP